MSITELSTYSSERSRKIHTTILNHLSTIGQVRVFEKTGIDEGVISKLKNTHLENFSCLLSACGLKVVPQEYKCIDPLKAQAMVTLYEAAMSKVDTIELLWGDE